MYKGTSENSQRRVSRIDAADQMQGRDTLSMQDQLAGLQRAATAIRDRFTSEVIGGEERLLLSQRFNEINAEIKRIKPLVHMHEKVGSGIPAFFIEEAKRLLPPGQFKTIFAAAERQYRTASAEAAE